MRHRSLRMAAIVGLGLFVALSSVSAGDDGTKEFWSVWRNKKSTNLEKNDAVNALIGGEELVEPYVTILEGETWQYRASVTGRIQGETNEKLLAKLEEFLFDEKEVSKNPAAAEHILWALYNNSTWVKPEKWDAGKMLVMSKKVPDKVKARMLRELGVFRGAADNPEAQTLARQNVKVLVEILTWAVTEKKVARDIRFLVGDALESLTSQDFGDDLDKWRFFANNMKVEEPLKPRTAVSFKDSLADVDIEGHSFSSPRPRPVDLEMLILPDLGKSDRYWSPYIFELNKTFKCTFVKLPDCSRMKDLEWMKDRNGNIDRTAYYYPLKQLVEAFEERREQSKQKKIGIIAHGVSGWIALEYLRLHPESVAFAVIIQTWSGAESRDRARGNMAQSKDDSYKYYAEDLVYDPSGRQGSLSLNEEQKFWSGTGSFKRRWADPKALEPIFYAQQPWREQIGGNARILVPAYNFDDAAKGKRIGVPTLFIHGTNDPMYPEKDMGVYKKVFTNMVWEDFKESSDTPWAEEPIHFFEAFQSLLDKNKIIEKLKEDAEEERKNEGK